MSDIVERLERQYARTAVKDFLEAANEIERLRGLVMRAADFCDYETFNGEQAEYGIRCCCGTRDFESHRKSCEYGKEVTKR